MIAPNAVSSDDLGGARSAAPAARAARRSTACGSVGERAAEVDDQLVELVERERVRVLAVVDQDAAEERRADQAVVLDADRVAEQRSSGARRGSARPRRAADTTRAARRARPATCASVHFMFVMRPPVAACASAVARAASGASPSSSGGIQGMGLIIAHRPAWPPRAARRAGRRGGSRTARRGSRGRRGRRARGGRRRRGAARGRRRVVAASSASSVVMRMSRTASAMQNAIEVV